VKASECGPKGVLIVEVNDEGRFLSPRFVDCSSVRFERVSVRVDSVEDITQLNDVVNEVLGEVVTEASGVPVLVRLEFTGVTDLGEIRSMTSPSWDSIIKSMIAESKSVMRDGAIVKVRTSCRAKIDLAAERDGKTVLGIALNNLDILELDIETKNLVTDVLVNAMTGTS
jgi:hypothetical protein